MESSIEVSVIIPTYNRKESLLRTLSSLAGQTYPANQFEVIVVDDGSADETHSICVEVYPYRLLILRQENQGSAKARNRGTAEGRGELLVFLDDDMLLEPDYLIGLVALHDNVSNIVGMGTCLSYLTKESSLFEKVSLGNIVIRNIDNRLVEFTACTTNNLSIRREDFFQIGQMQDIAGDGPAWWGDVDFGYRAWKAGMEFYCSGRAICYHNDYSTRNLESVIQRSEKAARMAVLLWQRYPDILEYLPMFDDKRPVDWSNDSLRILVRKLLRQLSASRVVVWVLDRAVQVLERGVRRTENYGGKTGIMLRSLYRWINGAYIYRGFQDGLKIYGIPN